MASVTAYFIFSLTVFEWLLQGLDSLLCHLSSVWLRECLCSAIGPDLARGMVRCFLNEINTIAVQERSKTGNTGQSNLYVLKLQLSQVVMSDVRKK